MKEGYYKLYCLKYVGTEVIFYIGVTSNERSRILCHKLELTDRPFFLEILKELGYMPISEAVIIEKEYILKYSKMGYPMLNKMHNPNHIVQSKGFGHYDPESGKYISYTGYHMPQEKQQVHDAFFQKKNSEFEEKTELLISGKLKLEDIVSQNYINITIDYPPMLDEFLNEKGIRWGLVDKNKIIISVLDISELFNIGMEFNQYINQILDQSK